MKIVALSFMMLVSCAAERTVGPVMQFTPSAQPSAIALPSGRLCALPDTSDGSAIISRCVSLADSEGDSAVACVFMLPGDGYFIEIAVLLDCQGGFEVVKWRLYGSDGEWTDYVDEDDVEDFGA